MLEMRLKPWNVSRFFDYFDVAVSLGVAAFVLKLWLFPSAGDTGNILTLCFIMVVEFIMVHSGAMMAFARGFSRLLPLIFVPLYGLFIIGFAVAAGDNGVVWLYCFVVLTRVAGGFFVSEANVLVRQFKCAFFHGIIYFAALFLVVVGSEAVPVPRFGLTEAFLESAGYYAEARDAYGLMPWKPQVAMCFAVVYHCGLAVFDFWVARTRTSLKSRCRVKESGTTCR